MARAHSATAVVQFLNNGEGALSFRPVPACWLSRRRLLRRSRDDIAGHGARQASRLQHRCMTRRTGALRAKVFMQNLAGERQERGEEDVEGIYCAESSEYREAASSGFA